MKAKHSNLEIARSLKVARSFVRKVRKEVNENNGDELATIMRKQHCQCSDSLRTPKFVRRAHGMIDENPGKSMRNLAKDLQVSEGTIRNVLHQDLGYKSCVLKRIQFMSIETQENRSTPAKRLLNKLKHPEEQECLWFFSDEKYFDQDQKVNPRNDRWLSADPTEVPTVMCPNFPATVMIFGVVST
jgi:hypothetical protein